MILKNCVMQLLNVLNQEIFKEVIMSIWKNMQIFIAMYISFCSIISHAETIVDDEKLMNYAIVDFYKTYRESGIQGNIVEIKECYQNKTQILYCFYYDYLARIMDIEITRELGFSNDEFFNDELLILKSVIEE